MSLKKLLTEMPQISVKDGIVYADADKLKELSTEDVSENIVLIRQPTEGFLPKGATWVYFMDSAQSARDMGDGKLAYIMLFGGSIATYGQTPEFQKVFKKKAKGREKILGFMQGYSDENLIRIDYMKVRKSHRRQSINKKMLEVLIDNYPNAEIRYDELTKDGKAFAKKLTPDSPTLKEN